MIYKNKFYIYLVSILGIVISVFLFSNPGYVSAEEANSVTVGNEQVSHTDIDAEVQVTTSSINSTSAANVEYKRKSVKIKGVKVKKLTAKVSWDKLSDAKKYEVYLYDNNKWKKIKTTASTDYKIKKLENCKIYYVRVRAIVNTPHGVDYSYFSEDLEFKIMQTKLYKLKNVNLLNKRRKVKVKNVSGYYTGYENDKYKGYILIDYNYGTYLVKKSKVKIVKGANVLPTSAVSQIDGKYKGYSACGPTAAVILLNSEKKEKLNKDDLIRYTKNKKLNDQGSLTKRVGGMTSPKLIKLIKAYGYNASNIYDDSVKSSSIIKKQIDSGKRVIALVKYSGGIKRSKGAAHFVVVCGYKYIDGKLYFYYADPFYTSGEGRSLLKVSASTLNKSMSRKFSEPNTILVLE